MPYQRNYALIIMLIIQLLLIVQMYMALLGILHAGMMAIQLRVQNLRFLLADEIATRRPVGRLWTIPKSDDWYKHIFPILGGKRFKEHFRITRNSFNRLVEDLYPYLVGEDSNFRFAIPVEKKVAIGLFRLASTSELRVICELFGVGTSTVHKIQYEFCNAVIAEYHDQISWPTTDEEVTKIASEFERLWGYPFSIGAIDGCHIPCSPEKKDATDYYNYKGWYSTVLLAICDANYLFTYINFGTPGKTNDGFIFKHSRHYRVIQDQLIQFRDLGRNIGNMRCPLHLIGDAAFTLSEFLMKPFPYVSNLDEGNFNYRLSRARRCIENAFGRLKARFRIILKRAELNTAHLHETVHACVILHNLFERLNEDIPDRWLDEVADDSDDLDYHARLPATRSAIELRREIATYLRNIPLI